MGWGGARAHAGRPRKTEHELRLSGTFRADRHASNVVELPAVQDPRSGMGDGWKPTQRARLRLGKAGRRYLDDVLERFDISASEGPAVLQIAASHDDIERLRLWQKKSRVMREKVQLEKLILEHQKRIDQQQQKLVNGTLDQYATEAHDHDA
jgi:hypothetical protein